MRIAKELVVSLSLAVLAVVSASTVHAEPLLKPGQRLVFLGDSVTQQCIYTRYVMDYFAMRYPGATYSFRNAGIGGDCADWAAYRIDRDVLSLRPDVVTIIFGANDAGYKEFSQEAFDKYMNGLRQIVEKLKAAGVQVVLFSPTCVDEDIYPKFKPFFNKVLARFGAGAKQIAEEEGLTFFDLHALMMEVQIAAKTDDTGFTMNPDGTHPNDAGHAVIAYAMLKALGCADTPASLAIDVSTKACTPDRCTVGGLDISEGRVVFMRTDDALPVTLDEDADAVRKYLPFWAEMNRYMFTVTGLAQGNWKLTVNDIVVGTYTGDDLAAGVNLADCVGPWKQMGKAVNAISMAQEDIYLSNWRVSREQLVEPDFTRAQIEAARERMNSLPELLESTRLKATADRTWKWVLKKE